MISGMVLLPCTAYKGKHKILDQWENTIYKIVEKPFKNMPVFLNQTLGVMTESKEYIGIYYYNFYVILWIMLVNWIIVGLWLIQKKPWAHGWQLQQVQLPVMCITWVPMKEYRSQT